MKTMYASIPNLYYAVALGTVSTCVTDLNGNQVCGVDLVRAQVEGQRVCQTGWGCTIHQFWDNSSNFASGGPTFFRDLLNDVQGSPYVPRVGVTEQGLNQGGVAFGRARDCTLRNFTRMYPSKVRFAWTYTMAHVSDGPREDEYWIKQRSQICD